LKVFSQFVFRFEPSRRLIASFRAFSQVFEMFNPSS